MVNQSRPNYNILNIQSIKVIHQHKDAAADPHLEIYSCMYLVFPSQTDFCPQEKKGWGRNIGWGRKKKVGAGTAKRASSMQEIAGGP
jgi:hypothetical protein